MIYELIGIALTAIVAWLSYNAVQLIRGFKDSQTKAFIAAVAQDAVLYVEQKYPDALGTDKLAEAVSYINAELGNYGIELDEERIKPIVEAQVKLLINNISAELIGEIADSEDN